ncbi:crossover junction endonuclease EME1 [Marchantia polymorpha subsp. ruderalis]|uniref:ERCC4 domain-containing protein n=4 Tax=Marchantia polymorpha TaxID=3197 RepID=A0AAF6BAZ2_MARPO|nr:hypothetical protein MARPO_0041s0060 [Marchantia polymorpha]BBN09176.1 hypothetical protein Mp_4g17790 [Marchantia polymorpha subsp. ruderalis]|eukprot:PTQ40164.1 hypothetical protein MARPO_0041s0060 [Marchantia polymorpha]
MATAVLDSDDDHADEELLLDWRGPAAVQPQGTLGFKQVKLRAADAVKAIVPKPMQVQERNEKRKADVYRSCENVVFVSLSDDEEPVEARKKSSPPFSTSSAKHADIVCLDSDSDSEKPLSTDMTAKSSATIGKVEETVLSRTWNKASCPENATNIGPKKQYEFTPPCTSRADTESGVKPPLATLERSTCTISEVSKLGHQCEPTPEKSVATYEKPVGSTSGELVVTPRVTAGSTSRNDRTEFEFLSSEERVSNFRRILEGTVDHGSSSAKPARRRGDKSARAAQLSVYDFEDEAEPAGRNGRERSRPIPEGILKERSENMLVPASVTAVKSSLSRSVESHDKLSRPSHIVIEDLSSSEDDEESRERFVSTSNGQGGTRVHGRRATSVKKWSPAAAIDVDDLSADEASDSERPHAGREPEMEDREEPLHSMSVSVACHTSHNVAPEVLNIGVCTSDLDVRFVKSPSVPMPPKRKCVRSVEYLEGRFAGINTPDFETEASTAELTVGTGRISPNTCKESSAFETTKGAIELEKLERSKGTRGRRRLSSDKDLSAFEASKVALELEKSEKKKEREREHEARNALKEEEKRRRKDEALKRREELKQQKEAAKAEAAERKRIEQECSKWKKGKFALEHTTIYIDKRIIESKTLGPPLLQQLASKEYTYQVVTNPIQKTILWTMKMPPEDSQAILDALGSQNESISNSQLPLEEVEIKYVVVFLDAAEFTEMVEGDAVNDHISRVKKQHPGYSLCYLVNNLTRYIYKLEQTHYRAGNKNWRRPKVEQVLAEFITHHVGVLSRLCLDENEMAEHILGLTRGLAECPFKSKLTTLTINANGQHLSKNDPNRDVIKRDPWKRALAAIPNITGAAVIAIARVYPTMRALLNAYLDPTKTVLEKEFLLQDIVKDAVLGSANAEGRRVGPVCSKRIYRLLMAQNGNLRTEAAEDGEDYFSQQRE